MPAVTNAFARASLLTFSQLPFPRPETLYARSPYSQDVQTSLLIILDRISVHPALFDTPMDLIVLPLKHDGVGQDGADPAGLNSPGEDMLTCTLMR